MVEYVCSNVGCGRSFVRPVKLTVLCSDPVETYLACPFCMSRVELEEEKSKPKLFKPGLREPVLSVEPGVENEGEGENVQSLMRKEKRFEVPEVPESGKSECLHEFGYLKNRPKGKPIPDECLTCPKMIQCLM